MEYQPGCLTIGSCPECITDFADWNRAGDVGFCCQRNWAVPFCLLLSIGAELRLGKKRNSSYGCDIVSECSILKRRLSASVTTLCYPGKYVTMYEYQDNVSKESHLRTIGFLGRNASIESLT